MTHEEELPGIGYHFARGVDPSRVMEHILPWLGRESYQFARGDGTCELKCLLTDGSEKVDEKFGSLV